MESHGDEARFADADASAENGAKKERRMGLFDFLSEAFGGFGGGRKAASTVDNLREEQQWAGHLRGGERMARLWLESHGSEWANRCTSESETPLMVAARCGDEALWRLLIENGANPQAHNRFFVTPLMEAAAWGNEKLARLAGESSGFNRADAQGRTALIRCAGAGSGATPSEAMIRWLIENTDVSLRDASGRDALGWAAEIAQQPLCARLLAERVNPLVCLPPASGEPGEAPRCPAAVARDNGKWETLDAMLASPLVDETSRAQWVKGREPQMPMSAAMVEAQGLREELLRDLRQEQGASIGARSEDAARAPRRV
jgi:hypothetical protein